MEFSLVKSEPMSYIRAAEDIGNSNLSRKELQNVRHLYVLAAVLDPSLRQSSILGLAGVKQNDAYLDLLHSMSKSENDLLVPEVVLSRPTATGTQQFTPLELCKTIEKIRNGGENLNLNELEQLHKWRHLFPKIYDRTLEKPIMREPLTSPVEVVKTIKVELAILGGPTVWSSDYIDTQGRPVTFSQSDDLASLFEIDPTKTNYVDGKWVAD